MIKQNSKTKRTHFEVSLPEANKVALVGDFNGWNHEKNPMKRDSKGVRKTNLKLPEGRHEFRYLVNESEWQNDPDCPTVSNNFNSINSIANVRY